ncbi:hypothetical protein K9U39_20560 [Rhodoblastus acidophilus]|nr:hypothetical protein [Rhodoblastus acidophilus]
MRAQPRGLASREVKLDALQQKLAESVGNLVTGDDWKRAMEFAARFRTRSFNNTLLISDSSTPPPSRKAACPSLHRRTSLASSSGSAWAGTS